LIKWHLGVVADHAIEELVMKIALLPLAMQLIAGRA
jgi:hypothetical protein